MCICILHENMNKGLEQCEEDMHTNPQFMADMAAARAEYARLKGE